MSRLKSNVLFTVSGALFLLGIIALVFPVRAVEPREAGAPPEVPVVTPSPSDDAAALLAYQEIVTGNVFTGSRTPPSVRYIPPDLAANQTPQESGPPAAPRIRLYGVASGPTGAVALIDADASIPGAEIYRIGDLVRGLILEEIGDSYVVLRGASGPFELLLETPRSRR